MLWGVGLLFGMIIVVGCSSGSISENQKERESGASTMVTPPDMVFDIRSLYQFNEEEFEMRWGKLGCAPTAAEPQKKVCGYGHFETGFRTDSCGFQYVVERSRYDVRYDGHGEIVTLDINVSGKEVPFSSNTIKYFGLESLWPDEMEVEKGGPGQSFIWTQYDDITRLEMQSTEDLGYVSVVRVWFQETPFMGDYVPYTGNDPIEERDCYKRFFSLAEDVGGGVCAPD